MFDRLKVWEMERRRTSASSNERVSDLEMSSITFVSEVNRSRKTRSSCLMSKARVSVLS